MRALFLPFLLLSIASCTSLFNIDSTVVNTPLHDDTRVFYIQAGEFKSEHGNVFDLVRPFQQVPKGDQTLVQNGDPVSIVVNRVVLPRHLFNTGLEDDRDSKTYDIAVVLDVAATAGEDEKSIAVFYQRGVKANTALSFADLLVYSQDNWDNRVPPYFRIRIFSVASERNERTRELLDQISGQFGTLSNIVSAPYAEPFLQVASRAAELVTQGDNEMLVDFQFQLYSSAQTSESGGMPLGRFRKGGMIIAGVPRSEQRQYWTGKSFQYDLEGEQVLLAGDSRPTPVDLPFLVATVITTDTIVPNIVKRRSAEIFEILRDDEALRYDFEKVSTSLQRLGVAVDALKAREEFATNPTTGNLSDYIEKVASSEAGDEPGQISLSLQNWLLATIRASTGVRLSDAEDYQVWMDKCASQYDFNPELRRFVPRDDTPEACKTGAIVNDDGTSGNSDTPADTPVDFDGNQQDDADGSDGQ
ncbi:hypothetical protein [Hyphomonas jannaschiana]|uniref:Lipoprotein n=1 Tax=Hyphomonas jannaschiana VP2 TaxID=1280952 RepID=A0A059F7Q6_9PROT|nr:hypothetical protein [Hyphomonas jannaschiana]KCZ86578.1 hypothetical protein HJA_15539 [Hyphomonas jannaschiana VP2]